MFGAIKRWFTGGGGGEDGNKDQQQGGPQHGSDEANHANMQSNADAIREQRRAALLSRLHRNAAGDSGALESEAGGAANSTHLPATPEKTTPTGGSSLAASQNISPNLQAANQPAVRATGKSPNIARPTVAPEVKEVTVERPKSHAIKPFKKYDDSDSEEEAKRLRIKREVKPKYTSEPSHHHPATTASALTTSEETAHTSSATSHAQQAQPPVWNPAMPHQPFIIQLSRLAVLSQKASEGGATGLANSAAEGFFKLYSHFLISSAFHITTRYANQTPVRLPLHSFVGAVRSNELGRPLPTSSYSAYSLTSADQYSATSEPRAYDPTKYVPGRLESHVRSLLQGQPSAVAILTELIQPESDSKAAQASTNFQDNLREVLNEPTLTLKHLPALLTELGSQLATHPIRMCARKARTAQTAASTAEGTEAVDEEREQLEEAMWMEKLNEDDDEWSQQSSATEFVYLTQVYSRLADLRAALKAAATPALTSYASGSGTGSSTGTTGGEASGSTQLQNLGLRRFVAVLPSRAYYRPVDAVVDKPDKNLLTLEPSPVNALTAMHYAVLDHPGLVQRCLNDVDAIIASVSSRLFDLLLEASPLALISSHSFRPELRSSPSAVNDQATIARHRSARLFPAVYQEFISLLSGMTDADQMPVTSESDPHRLTSASSIAHPQHSGLPKLIAAGLASEISSESDVDIFGRLGGSNHPGRSRLHPALLNDIVNAAFSKERHFDHSVRMGFASDAADAVLRVFYPVVSYLSLVARAQIARRNWFLRITGVGLLPSPSEKDIAFSHEALSSNVNSALELASVLNKGTNPTVPRDSRCGFLDDELLYPSNVSVPQAMARSLVEGRDLASFMAFQRPLVIGSFARILLALHRIAVIDGLGQLIAAHPAFAPACPALVPPSIPVDYIRRALQSHSDSFSKQAEKDSQQTENTIFKSLFSALPSFSLSSLVPSALASLKPTEEPKVPQVKPDLRTDRSAPGSQQRLISIPYPQAVPNDKCCTTATNFASSALPGQLLTNLFALVGEPALVKMAYKKEQLESTFGRYVASQQTATAGVASLLALLAFQRNPAHQGHTQQHHQPPARRRILDFLARLLNKSHPVSYSQFAQDVALMTQDWEGPRAMPWDTTVTDTLVNHRFASSTQEQLPLIQHFNLSNLLLDLCSAALSKRPHRYPQHAWAAKVLPQLAVASPDDRARLLQATLVAPVPEAIQPHYFAASSHIDPILFSPPPPLIELYENITPEESKSDAGDSTTDGSECKTLPPALLLHALVSDDANPPARLQLRGSSGAAHDVTQGSSAGVPARKPQSTVQALHRYPYFWVLSSLASGPNSKVVIQQLQDYLDYIANYHSSGGVPGSSPDVPIVSPPLFSRYLSPPMESTRLFTTPKLAGGISAAAARAVAVQSVRHLLKSPPPQTTDLHEMQPWGGPFNLKTELYALTLTSTSLFLNAATEALSILMTRYERLKEAYLDAQRQLTAANIPLNIMNEIDVDACCSEAPEYQTMRERLKSQFSQEPDSWQACIQRGLDAAEFARLTGRGSKLHATQQRLVINYYNMLKLFRQANTRFVSLVSLTYSSPFATRALELFGHYTEYLLACGSSPFSWLPMSMDSNYHSKLATALQDLSSRDAVDDRTLQEILEKVPIAPNSPAALLQAFPSFPTEVIAGWLAQYHLSTSSLYAMSMTRPSSSSPHLESHPSSTGDADSSNAKPLPLPRYAMSSFSSSGPLESIITFFVAYSGLFSSRTHTPLHFLINGHPAPPAPLAARVPYGYTVSPATLSRIPDVLLACVTPLGSRGDEELSIDPQAHLFCRAPFLQAHMVPFVMFLFTDLNLSYYERLSTRFKLVRVLQALLNVESHNYVFKKLISLSHKALTPEMLIRVHKALGTEDLASEEKTETKEVDAEDADEAAQFRTLLAHADDLVVFPLVDKFLYILFEEIGEIFHDLCRNLEEIRKREQKASSDNRRQSESRDSNQSAAMDRIRALFGSSRSQEASNPQNGASTDSGSSADVTNAANAGSQQQQPSVEEESLENLEAKAHHYAVLLSTSLTFLVTLSNLAPTSLLSREFAARAATFIGLVFKALVHDAAKIRVADPKRYNFSPGDILKQTASIFVRLCSYKSHPVSTAVGTTSASADPFVDLVHKIQASKCIEPLEESDFGSGAAFLWEFTSPNSHFSKDTFINALRILTKHGKLSSEQAKTFETAVERIGLLMKERARREEALADHPMEYEDSILFDLMSWPVRLPSNIHIDFWTLKRQLMKTPKNPYTNQPLMLRDIVPNVTLKRDMDEWAKKALSAASEM